MPAPYDAAMAKAIELAMSGRGLVEPNPMVGAILFDSDGHVISQGAHLKFGGPHAEIHALQAAGIRAKGGTLIVTLEPCCHLGKTPPCSEAIIRAGIRRVVVAMRDPFPKVDGGGIAQLQNAGIDVQVGLRQDEAKQLNAPYLMRQLQGRPWVISKWAMTLDGKIATASGDSKWITNTESRAIVHTIRGQVDAIMVGAETVRQDDPLLMARPSGSRIASRIIATCSGMLPADCQLLRTIDQAPVLIWTTKVGASQLSNWKSAGAKIDMSPTLTDFLQTLGRQSMTNLFVEGGGQLHGHFLDAGLIDEVMVFLAPILIGGHGSRSPISGHGVNLISNGLKLFNTGFESVKGDCLIRGRVDRTV